MKMKHSLSIRIYYEDTDCGGVVYYANYLRYFERGRTEFLRDCGFTPEDLMKKGIYFVVAHAELDYLLPGRYGDLLSLDTFVTGTGPASVTFMHEIKRGEELLVRGTVKLASVSGEMRPLRLPPSLREILARCEEETGK
jgi:acyl-CoA thioester hydrolase